MTLKKLSFIMITLLGIIVLVTYGMTLLLALITAVLLEPMIVRSMRLFKMNRTAAVSVVFSLFLIVFGFSVYWATTTLIVQLVTFAKLLPYYSDHLVNQLSSTVWKFQMYYETIPPEWAITIQQMLVSLKQTAMDSITYLSEWAIGAVASVPKFLLITIIYLLTLFLISIDLPSLRLMFLRMFSASARQKVELILTKLGEATVGFLGAQIILSVMTYILTLIGLKILDVKFAFFIALLVILVDILPVLGTGSFFVPWAVYSYFAGDTMLATGLIILFVTITLIRRIIEPKLLGKTLGISTLAALTSLYIGFQIFGFIGFVIGPALVIIFEALRKAGFLKFKIDF